MASRTGTPRGSRTAPPLTSPGQPLQHHHEQQLPACLSAERLALVVVVVVRHHHGRSGGPADGRLPASPVGVVWCVSAVFEFHVMQQRVMRIDGGANPGMTQQGGGSTLAQTVFKTHMADGDDDPVETLISRLVFVEVRTTTEGSTQAGSRPACKPCAD